MKVNNVIIQFTIAAAMLVSVMIGYMIGVNQLTPPANQVNFGLVESQAYKDFPECFSPQMNESWSTRLMYLNGVWTAGCLNQSYKNKDASNEN